MRNLTRVLLIGLTGIAITGLNMAYYPNKPIYALEERLKREN